MFGFAYNALREAIYGEQSDRLLIVRYESLVANPLGVLAAIYGFVGEELVPHEPRKIEPSYDMIEFDQRLGTPRPSRCRAHGRSAGSASRSCRPDLFARYQRDAFWEDLKVLPPDREDGVTRRPHPPTAGSSSSARSDQAFLRRRSPARPRAAKPVANIAQVEGSGTGDPPVSLGDVDFAISEPYACLQVCACAPPRR